MFSLTGLRPTRSASWIPRRTGASYLGYGHLVLVGHPRLQNRTEPFVVAIDAAEIASLRDAHADVSDFASEGVDEHEPS